MDLQEMRIFLVVAQERNISRAAERAFLSQPAVSRLVRRVEGGVGAQLFERSARELVLTPAGVRFCERIARVVDDFDRAAAEARAIACDHLRRNEPPAEIRVGALLPAAAELTGEILRAYRCALPEPRLRIVDVAALGGERSLLEGDVDVAFLWTPVSVERLHVIPLFDDPLMALLPRDHDMADCASVSPADLAEQAYTVSTSMSARWQAASLLPPWRHRPDRARPVNTVRDALETISNGHAVSIGPMSLERFSPISGIRYVPIEQTGRPTSVVCSRISDSRPQVQSLLAIAREVGSRLAHVVPSAFEPHGTTRIGRASRR